MARLRPSKAAEEKREQLKRLVARKPRIKYWVLRDDRGNVARFDASSGPFGFCTKKYAERFIEVFGENYKAYPVRCGEDD